MGCFISVEGDNPVLVTTVAQRLGEFLRGACSLPLDIYTGALPGACWLLVQPTAKHVLAETTRRLQSLRKSLARDRWVVAANWRAPEAVDQTDPAAKDAAEDIQETIGACSPDLQICLGRLYGDESQRLPRRVVVPLTGQTLDVLLLQCLRAARRELPVLPRGEEMQDMVGLHAVVPCGTPVPVPALSPCAP